MRKTEEVSLDFSEEKAKQNKGLWYFVYEWLDTLVYAVILLLFVFTFLIRVVGVSGNSMNPTLKSGDTLTVKSINTHVNRGDIVVVTQPNFLGEPLIKRVIAVGGDELNIDFFEHQVIVNGVVLNEPYIAEPTELMGDTIFPITIPEGKIFVMGDNRNDSLDSRSKTIGLIDERYVLGVANYRLFPFSSFGGVA